MKTTIATRARKEITVKDVKNNKTLERYLNQAMGNCKTTNEWNGEMYVSTIGSFKVVAFVEWGFEVKPNFTLWYGDRVICQGNDLRKCFRKFSKIRRDENAAINRTIKAIKF